MDSGATAWKDKGNSYYKQKQYEEALRCYSEAIRVDPVYADAWFNLAITCRALGYADEAVTCFERAKKYSMTGNDGYSIPSQKSFPSSPDNRPLTPNNSTRNRKNPSRKGKKIIETVGACYRPVPGAVCLYFIIPSTCDRD